MKWLVIVNRKAGGGSAGKLWVATESDLINAGINFIARFTEAPAQTRLLASNAISLGFNGVIIFGGDGTISDASAAISLLDTKPLLAFLPAGSGNDWIRSVGFDPPSIDSCIKAIAAGNTKIVDAGMCVWPGGNRFFLNSAGIGFDALVLKRATNLRRFFPLGHLNYLLTLVASALLPPRWRATIYSDGKPFYKGDYLTLTTGVGRYSGGGMQLSPSAVSDDGLLDSVVLSPMSFFTMAKHIGKLFDGTLHETRWATSAKGSVLRIEPFSPGALILELDGEVVIPGENCEYIELISKPDELRVIAPAEEQI